MNQESRRRVREAFRLVTYTPQELGEELKIIDLELTNLEIEKDSVEGQLKQHVDMAEKIASAKDIKRQYKKKLKRLDYGDKYFILQRLVKKVVINKKSIRLELRLPRSSVHSKSEYGDPDRIYPFGA